MTPTEYRAALAALNLSQIGAAKLFKVNPRTSRSWALGERPIPEAVAIALRLMIERDSGTPGEQKMPQVLQPESGS